MERDELHRYRLKEGFLIRRIGTNSVLIPLFQNVADFNGVITLNETATFLLTMLKEGSDIASMLSALINEYDVTEAQAKADISELLSELEDHHMLEE